MNNSVWRARLVYSNAGILLPLRFTFKKLERKMHVDNTKLKQEKMKLHPLLTKNSSRPYF